MKPLVLLTGASGFVGRQVLAALLARGDVAVRVTARDPAPFAGQAVDCVATDDLFAESAERLAGLCQGVDTIIHCAWYVEPGQYLFSPRNLACLRGTLQLAEAALAGGVRRFCGVGTCFEYALGPEPLNTDTPLDPQSPYAAAKVAAFTALSGILPAAGLSFAWARLFYLHGDGEQAGRLVPSLRAALAQGDPVDLTSGTQVRDFLDVAEAGRRIAALALSAHQGAANICSGQPVTVRALAESIADEYGRRDLLRFGARADNAVDPAHVVGLPTPIPAT